MQPSEFPHPFYVANRLAGSQKLAHWLGLALLGALAALLPAQVLAHDPAYGHGEPDWDRRHEREPHTQHDRHAAQHHQAGGYWNGLFNAALTFGGERLATVDVDTRYDGFEREDIRAGELFMFGGGLLYIERNFQLQGTVNYHVDGIFGDNGDASFTRWPFELLAFTTTPRWRIGGGVSYHVDPEIDIDIDFQAREKVSFKNATGIVIQVDYRLSDNLNIGLRHTAIEYEPDNNSNVEIDGDNTGIAFSVNF
ncbi:MAG: hypothetical protein WBN40_03635 [Pseudomonadales bacterium]